MLPVVGWAGEELEEGGSSWDLIESEADAAEDDASVEQMAAQVNSKASWGRRAHLRKRAGPRTKREATSQRCTFDDRALTAALSLQPPPALVR